MLWRDNKMLYLIHFPFSAAALCPVHNFKSQAATIMSQASVTQLWLMLPEAAFYNPEVA